MKTCIYLIIICLSFPCHLNAQTNIAGHEKYDSYNQYIYVDNLDQRLIPEIFNTTYYSKLKVTDYRVDSQKIDTIQQKREIYVYTKYAKEGYLFVNNKIMDKIKELDCCLNGVKVSYMYNDKIISTKSDVNRILKLKPKNMEISAILYDKKIKTISVYLKSK